MVLTFSSSAIDNMRQLWKENDIFQYRDYIEYTMDYNKTAVPVYQVRFNDEETFIMAKMIKYSV